jgi:hypothetical protein
VSSDESDAEIITSGLRIRRRHPPAHPNVHRPQPTTAEPFFVGEEGDGEDVAEYLADMPLSSELSGFSTDEEEEEEEEEESPEDESEDEVEAEADGMVWENSSKARLEMQHDAALRASLSTLLSCARALPPKRVEGLRVVQSVSPPSSDGSGRGRKRSRSRQRREREKVVRRTMVTLAVTVGAVVVLSVLSFSAGYLVRSEEARRVRVR